MSAVWVAVMAVGLVGMIVCSKKQRTNPALQPVSFLLFVVVLIGAFMWLRESNLFGGSGGAKDIISNELAFQNSRGLAAGKLMAKVAPGKKILAIADPNFDKDRFTLSMLESFKEAYGSNDLTIDSIVLPPNAEEEGIPLSDLMTAKAIDEIIAKYPDAGVILFVSGLPENPNRMNIFSRKDRPAVFLFSRGQANNKWLGEQIKSGAIAGIIIGKPKVKYSTKASSDPEEAFNIRYILVDKDNIAEHKARFE